MNAAMFYQRQTKAPQRHGFDYSSVILRAVQGIWQLQAVLDHKDEEYGKPEYGYMKIRFRFVRLVPGAEKAVTEEEQNRFRQMGHGKFLPLDVNPICSAPGTLANGEASKASSLYNLLTVLLNDGEPLTDEQLGKADDATIRAWLVEYGKREGAPPVKTISLPMARAIYAGEKLLETLQALAERKPQVYATPQTKTSKRTGNKYNVLPKIDALVPPEAQVPGGWRPFERPRDEREADDDENLLCAQCGRRTRGYERRDNKEWVGNRKAAESSIEQFGVVLCGVCIWKRRKADAGEE